MKILIFLFPFSFHIESLTRFIFTLFVYFAVAVVGALLIRFLHPFGMFGLVVSILSAVVCLYVAVGAALTALRYLRVI